MKILLLSDTHDHIDDLILQYTVGVDEIWHAGDIGTLACIQQLTALKPVRAVYGNIDGRELRLTYPLDAVFDVEGIKVWMTHIGGYPGHYESRVRKLLPTHRPDLFICGHSHILRVMRDPTTRMLCLNPGAAGVHGFHKMRTMLRFEISAGQILHMEAIELGPRGKLPK